jgi:O-antigen/teichoic acid export membrane protein
MRVGRVPLEAVGQPKFGTVIYFMVVVTAASLMWPFITLWGVQGAAWALFAGNAAGALPLLLSWWTRLGISPLRMLRAALPALLSSALLVAAYWPVYLAEFPRLVELPVVFLVGAVASFASAFVYWKWKRRGPFLLLLRVLNRSPRVRTPAQH